MAVLREVSLFLEMPGVDSSQVVTGLVSIPGETEIYLAELLPSGISRL